MKPEKRKPGGQPGNRNARKHGFYSGTLSEDELAALWKAVNVEHVDPDVAIIRLKLNSFVQKEAGNPNVLIEAARLVARWGRGKYGLSRKGTTSLRLVVERILTDSLETSAARSARPPDID